MLPIALPNKSRFEISPATQVAPGENFSLEKSAIHGDDFFSARALETDGVGDYVNLGNLGTLPKAVAKISYQALRGAANATPRFRLNASTDLVGPTLSRPGVWENHEIALTTPTASLTQVWLGRSGVGYSQCQLADVRFISADGEILARYQLNEHPAGLVNTLPALDSSGNGYHGSYVGGTSVAGIGVGANFRGLSEYGEYMWFGPNQGVLWTTSSLIPDWAGSWEVKFFGQTYPTPFVAGVRFMTLNNNNSIVINFLSLALGIEVAFGSYTGLGVSYVRLIVPDITVRAALGVWEIKHDAMIKQVALFLNGSLLDTRTYTGTFSLPVTSIRLGSTSAETLGVVQKLTINGTLIAEGNGTTSAAWGGGTVSGNPATIAEYRRTPPQVGMGDWNTQTQSIIYTSNFSSSVDGFIVTSGVTLSVSSSELIIASTSSNFLHAARRSSTVSGDTSLSLQIFIPSSNVLCAGYLIRDPLGFIFAEVNNATKDAWLTINIRGVCTSDELGIYMKTSAGAVSFAGHAGDILKVRNIQTLRNFPARLIPSTISNPLLDALANPIAVPRPTPTAFHSPNTSLFLSMPTVGMRCLTFWLYTGPTNTPSVFATGTGFTLTFISAIDISFAGSGLANIALGLPTGTDWSFYSINFTTAQTIPDLKILNSRVCFVRWYPRELSNSEIGRNELATIKYFGA
jgi:hypothetical protein